MHTLDFQSSILVNQVALVINNYFNPNTPMLESRWRREEDNEINKIRKHTAIRCKKGNPDILQQPTQVRGKTCLQPVKTLHHKKKGKPEFNPSNQAK